MKKQFLIPFVLLLTIFFVASCSEKECDQWYEGDPCKRSTEKFEGVYSGGGGFCGCCYDYHVMESDSADNVFLIGLEWTGPAANGNIGVYYTAVLTSNSTFDVLEVGSTDGTLEGNTLSFSFDFPGTSNRCEHVGVK